jgi:dihydrofolate reductase
MARNRVIGVNGKIPWNLPADRKHFVDLTRDKVLIMGRLTYEEEQSKSHISHAEYNIVVSTTLEPSSEPNLKIAHSFPEALHLAKLYSATDICNPSPETLDCWIIGGERIYDEALKHPSAQELHLTVVDTDIDTAKYGSTNTKVAMFPAKYRWDRKFDEISRSNHESIDCDGNTLKYTHVLYRPKRLP